MAHSPARREEAVAERSQQGIIQEALSHIGSFLAPDEPDSSAHPTSTPRRKLARNHTTFANTGDPPRLAYALLAIVLSTALLQLHHNQLPESLDSQRISSAISPSSHSPTRSALASLYSSLSALSQRLRAIEHFAHTHGSHVRNLDRRVAQLEHPDLQLEPSSSHFTFDSTVDEPNYALPSSGATVIAHSPLVPRPSPPGLEWSRRLMHLMQIFRPDPTATDLLLAHKGIEQPGDCLPLKGTSGFVDIRLSDHVLISSVTVSHVQYRFVNDCSSAPFEIKISAWSDTDGERPSFATELGKLYYTLEGQPMQTLRLSPLSHGRPVVRDDGVAPAKEKAFDTIRVHVLSNNGKSDYTCLYRVGVHGSQAPQGNRIS
jgi:SUN domain-containing protein 1/2